MGWVSRVPGTRRASARRRRAKREFAPPGRPARPFRARVYDRSMSERKARITVTIDPHLAAYAEKLVEAGKDDSVSAVVNRALESDLRDGRASVALLREVAAKADPAKVARMIAHADAQAAALGL